MKKILLGALLILILLLVSCAPDKEAVAGEAVKFDISKVQTGKDVQTVSTPYFVYVKGRLAFSEDSRCNDDNSNYIFSWSKCHSFKRHFDPITGTSILSDSYYAGAYRPIPAYVEVSLGFSNQLGKKCPKNGAFTSLDGDLNIGILPCSTLEKSKSPDLLKFKVQLYYNVTINAKEIAEIRSIMLKGDIDAVYKVDSSPVLWTVQQKDYKDDYVYATFEFNRKLSRQKEQGEIIDLGVLSFLDQLPPAIVESAKVTLDTWQAFIEYHSKLRNSLADQPDGMKLYKKMFVQKPEHKCSLCYTVSFLRSGGGSGGGEGGAQFLKLHPIENAIFDVDIPLGHEFGHSIHASLAPTSFNIESSGDGSLFGSSYQDKQGKEYSSSHNRQQVQDMHIAFLEGVPEALTRYLIDGCTSEWLNDKQQPPPKNSWLGEIDPSCDDKEYCSYHQFRFQMSKRGIAEGSKGWNDRLTILQDLKFDPNILSNNEQRFTYFLCDLLTTSSDISHAYSGKRIGRKYVSDHVAFIGRIMDTGIKENYLDYIKEYKNDVVPKSFSLSLRQVLGALDSFLPAGTILPDIGDPAYTEAQLSIASKLSPQSFGMYLVNKKLLTKDQLNNVLRANFMEEVN